MFKFSTAFVLLDSVRSTLIAWFPKFWSLNGVDVDEAGGFGCADVMVGDSHCNIAPSADSVIGIG